MERSQENLQMVPMILALSLNDMVFEEYSLEEEDIMKHVTDQGTLYVIQLLWLILNLLNSSTIWNLKSLNLCKKSVWFLNKSASTCKTKPKSHQFLEDKYPTSLTSTLPCLEEECYQAAIPWICYNFNNSIRCNKCRCNRCSSLRNDRCIKISAVILSYELHSLKKQTWVKRSWENGSCFLRNKIWIFWCFRCQILRYNLIWF